MRVVSSEFVKDEQGSRASRTKTVLLRLDIDVPLENGKVIDDFRLKAALPTLKLCLENSSKVVIIGHLGRPGGREVPSLSVAPVYQWFSKSGFKQDLGSGKLRLLENLRFDKGEEEASIEYAHSLVDLVDPENKGDVIFVNEAFTAHHPAASTTVLPKLLPHFAGLQFAKEVEKLAEIKNNPKRPLVAIIGGVKIEDKGPAIEALSKFANTVLVGGKIVDSSLEPEFFGLVSGSASKKFSVSRSASNILLAKLTEDGLDITEDTLDLWEGIIKGAKEILWNGPVGKVEDKDSTKGTEKLAKIILESKAEVIVGGGDTVGFLGSAGMLEKFEEHGFVSTGGGAMLEFLTKGTLPTIEALE